MTAARGIRNNNPGNIRRSRDRWQGLADDQPDKDFWVFKSPKWGVRALARLLITYQEKYNLHTIEGIVTRWAPPVENNTSAYVNAVVHLTGRRAGDRLDMQKYEDIEPLVKAIIRHENGKQPYGQEIIDEGLKLAGVLPNKVSGEAKGAAIATTGLGFTASAEALQEVQGQLEPLVGYAETLKWVFLGVALLGVALTAYARFRKARA